MRNMVSIIRLVPICKSLYEAQVLSFESIRMKSIAMTPNSSTVYMPGHHAKRTSIDSLAGRL
jgi:hypothetical protein